MSALFALAAAVGWGSSNFVAGRASRTSSAAAMVILTHLASGLVLLLVAVRVGSGGLTIDGSPGAADIAWGLAAGLAAGAGAMLLLHGLGKGSMAVVAPIAATGAASIPVLFGIVTGDRVTEFSLLGMALAFVAIVLVSLGGGDDGSVSDPAFDEPMVVPEGWTDEFQLPAPSGSPLLSAPVPAPPVSPIQTLDAPPVRAPLAPPPIEMTHSSVPAPPAPRFGIQDGELRMSLRTVREAVLALVATAVLSAAAIAARPIDQLLEGAEYSGSIAAQLVFALVIVGLAAFALNNVKPLFDFRDLARRKTASDVDRTSALSWRAIVGQPGVIEALFSGLGFGLFFVFISRAHEVAGHWPLVSARAVSVVMLVLIALASSSALLPERGSRLPLVLAGALDGTAAIFFVMSIRVGLLSVGAMLAALAPVVAVALTRVITKEHIRRQQMAGVGLALCAVGLLAI